MENICFSGGAEGADTIFGRLAKSLDHLLFHYSFADHKISKENAPFQRILEPTMLQLGRQAAIKANRSLDRKFPTLSYYADNLISRNYFQILNTHSIYACTDFVFDEEEDWEFYSKVQGGTAWAIQMYIDKEWKNAAAPDLRQLTALPIYILRKSTNSWYFHDCSFPCATTKGLKTIWRPAEKDELPPLPAGYWTGIGSRSLTKKNEDAILSRNSYKHV